MNATDEYGFREHAAHARPLTCEELEAIETKAMESWVNVVYQSDVMRLVDEIRRLMGGDNAKSILDQIRVEFQAADFSDLVAEARMWVERCLTAQQQRDDALAECDRIAEELRTMRRRYLYMAGNAADAVEQGYTNANQ